MASIFDNISYSGHGVAESTLMLATACGGHFYNMVSTVDIDNGSVMAVPTAEDYKGADYFEGKAPTATDKIVLILTAPKIYEEGQKRFQEEGNFYNGKGELMRAYEVYATDRFSLSKEAFKADAELAVGKYVKVDAGAYKLTTDATKPTDVGFYGKIISQKANGMYTIFVEKNEVAEVAKVAEVAEG